MKKIIPLLLTPFLLACLLTPVTTETPGQHERYRRATLAVEVLHKHTVDAAAKGLEWLP